LGDYLTTSLDHVAVHKVRRNTLARYRACVRLYFPAHLLKKKLSQLTAKDIRLWLD
jgi:hypothetical protein